MRRVHHTVRGGDGERAAGVLQGDQDREDSHRAKRQGGDRGSRGVFAAAEPAAEPALVLRGDDGRVAGRRNVNRRDERFTPPEDAAGHLREDAERHRGSVRAAAGSDSRHGGVVDVSDRPPQELRRARGPHHVRHRDRGVARDTRARDAVPADEDHHVRGGRRVERRQQGRPGRRRVWGQILRDGGSPREEVERRLRGRRRRRGRGRRRAGVTRRVTRY
mmetsp:Transcript_9301/g.33885  ORF Transcript_9301/g.33885 Transcript_9301/m.33885 type:complete len:219 (-) Transcript_9301:132-788(-)